MPSLDPYDSRDDVWLVREDSGRRYFAKLNLNSKKIFESEYYYLKNNDLLYVKPSRFTSNLFNTASPLKGLVTILGSVLALFLTLKSINL
jgi:polysaccharide export outer membrane protein